MPESVLRKLVVRIAVRRNHRMRGRSSVLRGMAIRRVVAAERRAARLAGTQVNPLPADLDALLALAPLRMFDVWN